MPSDVWERGERYEPYVGRWSRLVAERLVAWLAPSALGGQGPAPAYCARLSEDARRRLRDGLRSTLPRAGDGSIPLSARAWAVRGRVPFR